MGSFPALNGGSAENALKLLTGFDSLTFSMEYINKDSIDFFNEKLKNGCIFAGSFENHSYSILNFFIENENYFIHCRNPWGYLKNEIKFNEKAKVKIQKFNYLEKDQFNNRKNFIKSKEIFKDLKIPKDKKYSLITNDYEETGLFVIDFQNFKKFKKLTVCQILFNSTIYSYTILKEKDENSIYFKMEVSEDETLFGVSLYLNSAVRIPVSFKKNNIQDEVYAKIKIANTIKNEMYEKFKEFNPQNFDYFHEIKKGIYNIKIDIGELKQNSSLIVKIIIKGQNSKVYYLKDKEDNKSLNDTIDYTKYIYGERTGILFENFKHMIKFLEDYHKVKFCANAKGYYIETIFSNEIKTLIFTNKQDLSQVIGSINQNDDKLILTGTKHQNGKIYGKGAIKDLTNNRVIETIFNDNKIFNFDLDINKNNEYSDLIMSLTTKHNIIDEKGKCSIDFCMHNHKLFLKLKENWKCKYCTQDFKKYNCFFCSLCNFYLCPICYNTYCKLMFDKIKEVHIGFKKVGPPVQPFTDIIMFLPRIFLYSNPLTHKNFILASLFLRTLGGHEIFVEFGNFKGDIEDKNKKHYKTYYYTNEKNGLRFTEIKYDDYKNNILDYDKNSERIFKLYPLKEINLFKALEECHLNKDWSSDSYNKFFNNSKDFVAEFIKVTKSVRGEGEEHRGYHNYSKVVSPSVILNEIEKNEEDGWNTAGSFPIIGPIIGVGHFIGDLFKK